MVRRLVLAVLAVVVSAAPAWAQLVIPHDFTGRASAPISEFVGNWQAIADYVNTSPVINVKSFGATGNGTTDDTAPIVAAIAKNASDGTQVTKIVYFPVGEYKVSSTIEVPPNVVLRGALRFSTNAGPNQGSSIGCAFDGVCVRLVRRNASSGNLWHMGGVEDLGFIGPESFSLTSTTATKLVELGDSTTVTTSTGAWMVFVRRCTFSNATGGYGIYSAHSQSALIEFNWITQVKFPIYYATVVANAEIAHNIMLDQTAIAGAIAMQFRPGALGGNASMVVRDNYALGFRVGIWNTSIIGMVIRDNSFEGTYDTPIRYDSLLSDTVTTDGTGPIGGEISGNTFISWGNAGLDRAAINLVNSLHVGVGNNVYTSPNGSVVTAMLTFSDASCTPQCTKDGVWLEPVCSGTNCAGLPAMPYNSVTAQNTVIGKNYYQPQSVTFTNLGTALHANGQITYCSDCKVTTGTPGAPSTYTNNTCTSGGNGALAIRLNGANVCYQ